MNLFDHLMILKTAAVYLPKMWKTDDGSFCTTLKLLQFNIVCGKGNKCFFNRRQNPVFIINNVDITDNI